MNLRSLHSTAWIGLLCLMVAACAIHPPTHTSSAQSNPADTIIVPAEHSALGRQLRRNLAERGWTLIQYDSTMLAGNEDYARMAQRARYRLTLSGTPIGACQNGEPSFVYTLAIIENATGDVPLAMSGAKCLTPLVQNFADQLDQKRLVPQSGVRQTPPTQP